MDEEIPLPDAEEDQPITEDVDPDMRLLLEAVLTLTASGDRIDQGELLTLRRRWQSALRVEPPSTDAQLALLLASLPSLTTLKMSTLRETCDGLSLTVLHRLAGRNIPSLEKPLLGSLTHLRVDYGEVDTHASVSRVMLELPTIPTLTHFYGAEHGILEQGEHSGEYKREDSFPSLVYLELKACKTGPRDLATILRRCICLQTFVFEHDWDYHEQGYLSSSEIIQSLSPLRSTLECLWLSFVPPDCDIEDGLLGPVNLVEFQSLKSLHIAAKYLVGEPEEGQEVWTNYDYTALVTNASMPLYKRLPKSLEVLHIKDPDRPVEFQLVIEGVRELIRMQQAKSCFSHLREIRLEAPFEGDGSAFGVSIVQQEASGAGIRLRKLDISAGFLQSWIRGGPKPNDEWRAGKDVEGNKGLNGDLEWEDRLSYHSLNELV